ncbi:MAG: FlgD immunoglobulin-like domain containing protein [Chitinispirillaceae bacterium]|jgi:hypothetical protein
MHARPTIKTAILFAGLIAVTTGAFGAGINLEWQLTGLTAWPILPSYVSSASALYFPNTPCFDYDQDSSFSYGNNGIPNILVPQAYQINRSLCNLSALQIYDGSSYALISTVDYTKFSNKYWFTSNPNSTDAHFFDIANSGTKQLVQVYTDSTTGFVGIAVINVQTNTIELTLDTVQLYGVYDLSNDGHPDLWCVKETEAQTYTLQVWGCGPAGVLKSNQSVAKLAVAKLVGNTPNPFTAATKIDYYIPADQNVALRIYSADGRLVRSLVDGPQKMGEYSQPWDGKGDNGERLATGSYYYQLRIGDFVSSKKMVLLK